MAKGREEKLVLEVLTCRPLTPTGPEFQTGPAQLPLRLWGDYTARNRSDANSSAVKWPRGRLGGGALALSRLLLNR